MRLLLDTHIVLALLSRETAFRYPRLKKLFEPDHVRIVSVVSLWEIAIKTRVGKLRIEQPLENIAVSLEKADITLLDINRHHATVDIQPEPRTRDPFDRMLIAQCQVEGLKLVTQDSYLVNHPLAWRPDPTPAR